ncbi:MAG: hypothetical protein GDA40_03485 [Rhodobacteraceae bacterium]|nr:hypothetical protein [Paracoccaceae bacterium]
MTTYPALYQFNAHGLEIFKQVFFNEVDESSLDPVHSDYVSVVPGTLPFPITQYPTAKAMAQAVLDAMGDAKVLALLPNAGLWAWLTFVMRDQLIKRAEDGTWQSGHINRWYPSDPNDLRYARVHLVRMPVQLLRSFGNAADHLLCTPPIVRVDIRLQLTRQQDMLNETFQRVARALYYDDTTGTTKRGASGDGGGSSRRLAEIRKQLAVTWALEDLTPQQILALLPPEFDRFKPSP